MPGFKVVKDANAINLSDSWIDLAKFNSKDRVVRENGKPVNSSYDGRRYRLIAKKERTFSCPERFGRGFLGTLAVVCSLGIALLFKPVRNLFTKSKEKIRFAVLISSSPVIPEPPVIPLTNTKKKEYERSVEELQEGVSISGETISKIQTCMKNVLVRKKEGGVKLYNSRWHHRVFELDSVPGYIFKMVDKTSACGLGDGYSMKPRYRTMVNAQTVLRTHNLGLLVIPNAKLFTVVVEDEEYEIIAEKKLDINPRESLQEQYYEEYADSLNETIRQLAVFICKTGCSDVEWRNNPILNNNVDELGRRKIALIDIEEMNGAKYGLFGCPWPARRGLVRCVTEEQGKIVETVAKQNSVSISSFANAHSRRKDELEDVRKLKEYYQKKNITTGKEPVQVDVEKLDFSAYPGKVKKLKEVTRNLIEAINKRITEESLQESVKGRRYVYININKKLFKQTLKLIDPGENEFETANAFKTDEEYYNATFLGHIVKKLVDLEVIYKLVERNGNGYFIQA